MAIFPLGAHSWVKKRAGEAGRFRGRASPTGFVWKDADELDVIRHDDVT